MKTIELQDTVLLMKEIIEANPLFVYPVFDSFTPCVECCEIEELELEEDEGIDKADALAMCEIHIEQSCRYFDQEGHGQCAIGHWLIGSNLTDPELFGHEDFYTEIEGKSVLDVIISLRDHGGYEIDDMASQFLNEIQKMQDGGVAWFRCYNHAVTKLSNYGPEYTYPLIEIERENV